MSKSDCIEWTGAINSSGYGITWKDGKTCYAHRVAVSAPDDSVVLHICDNKICVNPEHLILGSHKENSEDMVNKGRQAKGEKAGNSKLKESEVVNILSLKGSMASRAVAEMYNISKTNVLDIWNRKIWKDLADE